MDATVPADQPRPPPAGTTIEAADAILLHVLSPSVEVPGGRITFPRIHLDTKLSQLKTRIQNALQAAPPPERQRLIYRGYALLNGDLSLRQVFRPHGSSDNSDTYSLHLVLPPSNSNAPPPVTNAQTATEMMTPPGLPPPPPVAAGQNGIPVLPNPQLPQQVLAQAQAAQMMLQNQLNLIQQQLGMNQPHQQHHINHPPLQNVPEMQLPNGMHFTYQIQNGTAMPVMPRGFFPAMPNIPNLQAMMAQQQQQMPHPATAAHQPMPTQRQPPQAEAVVTPPDGTGREVSPHPSAQLPGIPTTTRIHDTIGPQGQRIRTVVRESLNVSISRQGTPTPIDRPNSATNTNQGVPSQSTSSIPEQTSGIPAPAVPAGSLPQHNAAGIPRATPFPSMIAPPNINATLSPSNTMAWVLSSPSGPEAILFAPGHGYFSSSPSQPIARLTPTRTSHHRHAIHLDADPTAQVHAPNNPANPPGHPVIPAQQAVQQQVRALARQAHAQNGEENEILALIVQRGWLFLRLYIFTFFLSEPGTWRRYVLLSIATFVCMLPRNNPFNNAFTAVRRHVDALVGPAAPPTRPAEPGAAPMTTPQNAAPQVHREHEERNPSVLRDMLFRLERVMALFLASLVPGVGERHVRAREDARREEERVLRERREREEREREQAESTATAVEISETAEPRRRAAAEAEPIEAAA